MTEQRFTMDEDGNITDTIEDRTLYVENRYTACNYFTNLLNELNDENQQLCNDCSILVQSNQEYRNENEQLKEENQELRKYLGWQDMELEEMEDLND